MSRPSHRESFNQRRRWLPRYSIRTLLLVTLVCACGLAWWTRPFVVEYSQYRQGSGSQFFQQCIAISESELESLPVREVCTVRRTLTGDLIRDGLAIEYRADGSKVSETWWHRGTRHGVEANYFPNGRKQRVYPWVNGELHGELLEWDAAGNVLKREVFAHYVPIRKTEFFSDGRLRKDAEYRAGKETQVTEFGIRNGTIRVTHFDAEEQIVSQAVWNDARTVELERVEFVNCQRSGPAIGRFSNGNRRYEGRWLDGRVVGAWTQWNRKGRVIRKLEFSEGSLKTCGQKRFQPVTIHPTRQGDSDERLVQALGEVTELEVIETPLRDVLAILADQHRVPIVVDERRLVAIDPDLTITAEIDSIPLAAALPLILEPHGLAVTIRFEQLWVTTLESAKNWQDETGVSGLVTQPGSEIAATLSDPTECEFIEADFEDILSYLEDRHHASFRFDRTESTSAEAADQILIGVDLRGVTLRSALGTMLDQLDLVCTIEDDTFVVRRHAIQESSRAVLGVPGKPVAHTPSGN